jgi:DNA-binding beta-propeller fold protein YncE
MRHFASIALAVTLLTFAGAASGADGDPFLKSCFSRAGTTPCTGLGPPFSAFDAELAPGGGHLYVAVGDGGGGFNGLRLFDVGPGGSLAARPGAVYTTSQAPSDLDLSPEGRNVYVAAGSQLVVLSRDGSGALAPAQTLSGLSTFDSLAVSPDAASVYARGPNHLTVFDRNADTGGLTQKLGLAGCLTEETALPCRPDARGIVGTSLETVVSPDGRHVYTTNQVPGGVAVFNRAADGSLTQLSGADGCISVGGTSGGVGGVECLAGSPTLTQAWAANLDAQGAYVFVSANGGQTVFRRDVATGRLTQTDCLDEVGGSGPPSGCHEATGVAGTDAVVTPDGGHAALNAQGLGISFFSFDRAAGTLSQWPTRPCLSAPAAPPCQQASGLMGGAGGVTVSANGLNFFAAFRGGAVASVERDFVPRCQSPSITVRRRKPLVVPLACTDVNGDAVTLSISSPPTFGILGRVDQTNNRVLYTPDPRRKGKDTFRYRGSARGLPGPVATVTLSIVAAPAKGDRTPPNTRILAGPPKTTKLRTARFKFESTERGSEFQCKPDWRKRWTSCRSPKSYANLRRGRHSFRVRAIDGAGNADRTPAKRIWTITR